MVDNDQLFHVTVINYDQFKWVQMASGYHIGHQSSRQVRRK